MKRGLVTLTKIVSLMLFYALVLTASIFFTMSILLKGEELEAPDLTGKDLNEAYQVAADHNLYVKKEVGNYDKSYKPLTVIDQFPAAGTRIKEKSFIKVFISSQIVEIIVPDLTGHPLQELDQLLSQHDMKKRYIAYIESNTVPVDYIIAQSISPEVRIPSGTPVDILVSKGQPDLSFIMPDLIGMRADIVVAYFENRNLHISKITSIPYTGLEPGIVVNQFPSPGFRINPKNLISLQISK